MEKSLWASSASSKSEKPSKIALNKTLSIKRARSGANPKLRGVLEWEGGEDPNAPDIGENDSGTRAD